MAGGVAVMEHLCGKFFDAVFSLVAFTLACVLVGACLVIWSILFAFIGSVWGVY
jgi:hypothetical protein